MKKATWKGGFFVFPRSLSLELQNVPMDHPCKAGGFLAWEKLLCVKPKSVIRHAVSASDGENEAFGHYAST